MGILEKSSPASLAGSGRTRKELLALVPPGNRLIGRPGRIGQELVDGRCCSDRCEHLVSVEREVLLIENGDELAQGYGTSLCHASSSVLIARTVGEGFWGGRMLSPTKGFKCS